MRTDRPRIIAPAYKWQALPALIKSDPYLTGWNATIFGNATAYFSLPPVVYHMDGDSGILDNARETKERIKAFAYVYRMTNDTKWVDRAWAEIQVRIIAHVLNQSHSASRTLQGMAQHLLDQALISGILYIF